VVGYGFSTRPLPDQTPRREKILGRREFLHGSSASIGAALLPATVRGAHATQRAVFGHSVASGDPRADGVVLWTRVTADGPDAAVRWVVARDGGLRDVVAEGDATATADADHTVHVDVTGLSPATAWFYAFECLGERSPIGRTRTAPSPEDHRSVRLGVVSCASFAFGHFSAYRLLAARDLDAVVHLGDTTYEHRGDGARVHEPDRDAATLGDYRARHAQYHTDPDLQLLWRTHPVIAVWDDHDIVGNAWRDGPSGERLAAATRAWLEWTPIGRTDPPIWRSVRLGGAAELFMLDTRLDGRSRQVSRDDPDPTAAVADPARALVGDEQRAWLHDGLRSPGAAWRLVGNQVVLSPLGFDAGPLVSAALSRVAGGAVAVGETVVNADQWDGYTAERDRLLAAIDDRAGPVAVLTGDIHSSWAMVVPPGSAVELVTPAVASEPFAQAVGGGLLGAGDLAVDAIRAQHPHVRWADLDGQGYMVVEAAPAGLVADWWHVATVEQPTGEETWAHGVRSTDGTDLEDTAAPMGERAGAHAPAPPTPAAPGSSRADDGDTAWAPRVAAALAAAAAAVGGLLALRRRGRGS
jgi:alkaline phosphatase D